LSLAFGWKGRRISRIVDVGSGVGLPAIPLAVAFPESEVVSLDRSAKRSRLARRAARVLDLNNLSVITDDVERFETMAPVLVSRAAIPPLELRPHLVRLTERRGVACISGSHAKRPAFKGFETIDIPPEVLDRLAWILKMARFEEET
jgi:16S rRNA G527 N7-methylase RsmG